MRRALVLAALLAVPGLAGAADAVELKWVLKEDTTFYCKTTITQKQTVSFLGMDADTSTVITSALRYKVKSVEQGVATVEVTYLESAVEAKGLPIMVGDLGKKAKGAVVTLTVNEKSEITKVSGANKVEEKFKDAEGFEKFLGGMLYGEAAVTEMVSMPFSILPGKPVKAGDTWAKDEKGNAAGLEISGKITYTVDEVANDVAKISSKADLKVKPGGGDGGLPFKITKSDLKVEKSTSTFSFDLKAGRLKDMNQEMNIAGDMTASVAGMEVTLKMSTKQTVKLVVSDKAPTTD